MKKTPGETQLERILAENKELRRENRELRAWKESAIAVTPNWQEIGRLLDVGWGESVHDKIIPALKELVRLRDLRMVFIVCQGGLVQDVSGIDEKEYEVADLDSFEDNSEFDMHQYWHKLSSQMQDYLQRHWSTEIPGFARDPDKMPKKGDS